MDKDYSYSEYISKKQEESENKCELPMREQRKFETELHDLYRLER